MRLFQLINEDQELTGLFNVTISEDKLSDDDIEQILKDYQVLIDNYDVDAGEQLLESKNIEQVYVTEVYC
jgi:hypothetical protein